MRPVGFYVQEDLSGDGGVLRRTLQANHAGARPVGGKDVMVEYRGHLCSGKEFDRS